MHLLIHVVADLYVDVFFVTRGHSCLFWPLYTNGVIRYVLNVVVACSNMNKMSPDVA